jgi:flotillin
MLATIIFAVLGVLATAAGCIFAALFFRRIVPTNRVPIVQSAKQTTAYGKDKPAGNSYFEWPAFLPFIGVSVTTFPESIFQVTLKDYPAYDAARLPFEVDVAAFFKVQDAAMVAQRVASFIELNSQLLQVLQGAVRRILATCLQQAAVPTNRHVGGLGQNRPG